MGILTTLCSAFRFDLPSDYEDFYENLDWRSFRTDQTVYNRFYHVETDYIRALTYCFDSMVEDLQLNTVLDQARLIEKYNDLVESVTEMKLAYAELKAENIVLTNQLADARAYQTQAGRKVELGLDLQKETTPERSSAGQFTSSDGIHTKTKQMILFWAKSEGLDVAGIAAGLGVSSGSVASYISKAKKHCCSVVRDDDVSYYVWDSEYSEYEIPFKTLQKRFTSPSNELQAAV